MITQAEPKLGRSTERADELYQRTQPGSFNILLGYFVFQRDLLRWPVICADKAIILNKMPLFSCDILEIKKQQFVSVYAKKSSLQLEMCVLIFTNAGYQTSTDILLLHITQTQSKGFIL